MFANKQDLPGALSAEEIKAVYKTSQIVLCTLINILHVYCNYYVWAGFGFGIDKDPPLADHSVQCCHWRETVGRNQLDDHGYQLENFYYGLACTCIMIACIIPIIMS